MDTQVLLATRGSNGSLVSREDTAQGVEDRRLLIAGLAISAAIVAGMSLGSGPIMLLAAVAAIGAGLVHPPLGLLVVAFMGPLRPPLAIPAPGFNLVLVGAILLGCVYQLPFNRDRLVLRAPLVLALAFGGYVFVQQLPDMASGYASISAHDVGFLFYQLLAGLGTVVAAGFVLRGRSPYPFLAALVISATFAAVLGIIAAEGGHPLVANLLSPSEVAGRVTGPFGNPNALGQLLAYGIVLAMAWFTIAASVHVRTMLLIAVGILGYALALSLSRGGAATMLAGLVVLAFARGRTLGIAAVTVALAVVVIGYPLFVEFRLTTERGAATSDVLEDLNASDEGRLDAILAGPELFATSPIFGVGFGQYQYESARLSGAQEGLVAHNWYGTVLAELGLVGIVLWLSMLIMVGRWLRLRPPRPRTLGFALLGAVIVGSMFLQPPTSFQLSVVPIFVLTAALVSDWGADSATVAPTRRSPWARYGGHRGKVHRASKGVAPA